MAECPPEQKFLARQLAALEARFQTHEAVCAQRQGFIMERLRRIEGVMMAVAGALIAVFHLLLVAGVVPESIKPCVQGIPCTEVQIVWFGFVTIPMLSLLSFSLIGALLLLALMRSRIPK